MFLGQKYWKGKVEHYETHLQFVRSFFLSDPRFPLALSNIKKQISTQNLFFLYEINVSTFQARIWKWKHYEQFKLLKPEFENETVMSMVKRPPLFSFRNKSILAET